MQSAPAISTQQQPAKRSGEASVVKDLPTFKRAKVPTNNLINKMVQTSETPSNKTEITSIVRRGEGSIILEVSGTITFTIPNVSSGKPATITLPLSSVVSITSVDGSILQALEQ